MTKPEEPATSTLKTILAHIEAASQPYTPDTLARWLAEHLPQKAQAQQEAERLVQRLLDLQLLVFDIAGMQSETLARDVAAQLEAPPASPGSPVSSIREALHVIDARAQDYSQQPPRERASALREISTAVNQSL